MVSGWQRGIAEIFNAFSEGQRDCVMAESLDTLHVEVLDGQGLLTEAMQYSVTLAVGFWKKSTPFVTATKNSPGDSGAGDSLVRWRHALQIPKDTANDVLKVSLLQKDAEDSAEVAHAMVELKEMGNLLEIPGEIVEQ